VSTTAGLLEPRTWLDSTSAVLEVSDDLDLYAAPRLRDALMDLHRAGRNRLIVDMTALDFMDSSGLGVLIGGVKRARNTGGALVVVGASERVLKILRVTGVVRVMPAFGLLWEAFAYFDESSAT
jgi:anti-sigma B factor antagonist